MNVSKQALEREANTLAKHAADSAVSWALLGMDDKAEAISKEIAILRHAASLKSISARRQVLRDNGINL